MFKITLDHIDNVVLDVTNPPLKNLHAINFIPQGLYQLAMIVKIAEGIRIRRNGSARVIETGGLIPPMIPCIFHWFSVSLINYIRLVGLIDLLSKKNWSSAEISNPENTTGINSHCNDYAERVVPEVYKWRNKVSAHFAATKPFHNDNLGTIEESVMNSITYHTPCFKAGHIKWTTKGEVSELLPWSVTEIYENLSKRYWTTSKLDYFESACVPPTLINFAR